jgi:hypothetical protein
MSETRREQFSRQAREIATEFGEDLHGLMMKAFDGLGADRAKIDKPDLPFLLVRAVALAVMDQAADNRFDCQAIRRMTPAVQRALKRRHW